MISRWFSRIYAFSASRWRISLSIAFWYISFWYIFLISSIRSSWYLSNRRIWRSVIVNVLFLYWLRSCKSLWILLQSSRRDSLSSPAIRSIFWISVRYSVTWAYSAFAMLICLSQSFTDSQQSWIYRFCSAFPFGIICSAANSSWDNLTGSSSAASGTFASSTSPALSWESISVVSCCFCFSFRLLIRFQKAICAAPFFYGIFIYGSMLLRYSVFHWKISSFATFS